jgi:hypothetical protein
LPTRTSVAMAQPINDRLRFHQFHDAVHEQE